MVAVFGLSGLSFHRRGTADLDEPETDRHAFLVVDVPDHLLKEEPLELTALVSDRSARAADVTPHEIERSADPYADGNTEARELETVGKGSGPTRQGDEDTGPDRHGILEATVDGDLAEGVPHDGIADYEIDDDGDDLTGGAGGTAGFRNLLSAAGRRGALSFNTYDWDFGPYMLAMKRAIESHLFPPYAFTHMGLVSGANLVRFTVLPDGRIRGLEILGSDAHFSLDRTSVRAIESSVPFLPLPSDFPEEYLEVTAHFSYVIVGRD